MNHARCVMVTGIIYILKKVKNLVMIAEVENAIDWIYATDEQIREIIFTDMECPVELKWKALHEILRRKAANHG